MVTTSVAKNGFEGVLFPGDGRKDKVLIVMSGSDGGMALSRQEAEFYHKNGIPALCLALFKTKEDWMLNNVMDIFSFMESREDSDKHLKEARTGITYEAYLQMLLFVKTPAERDYRIMDVLQTNIRQDDDSFLMKDCLYGLHAEVECSSRHIFTLLGISRTGEVSPEFRIREKAVKAY